MCLHRKLLAVCVVPLLLILVPASASAAPTPQENRQAFERAVDTMLREQVAQHDWAGNVAIVYAGKQIVRGAYGIGDRTWQIPTPLDAVYRVGSVTKMFTAVTVLQLVQAGQVSLDASVRTYLPALPPAWQPVTIRHLLNHTSGVPEYMASTNSFRTLMRVDRTPDAVLALVQDQPLRFVPGSKYEYSNTNYVALGLIIEKLTGKPYADVVETRFLKPLGMTHSGYFDYTRIVPSLVPGYFRDEGRLQNMFYIAPSMVYAAGNLYLSIDDLLRWDRALHDTDALGLTPALRREMLRNQGFGYGLGAFVDTIDGESAVGHGGTLPGYQLGYEHFMRLPLTVLVLTNVSPTDVDKMAADLAKLFFKFCGKTAPAAQCDLATPARSDGAQDADPKADARSYREARAAVADLERIVAPGGVQESYKTPVGGIDQWINVRGQDRANPMILFVHGGPASPITPTMWQFQRPIEEYFTVANYDQRGAGKTYGETDPSLVADTIHIERYVDDAIEVAEHLRQRHGKRKLVLMGHSWGTIVAMKAALKRPDLFYAYVGIGQVINVRENERIGFEYALAQARAHGNAEALRELNAIAPYPGDQPITRERIIVARKWPQYYGGLSAFRSNSTYFFDGPLLAPDYDSRQVGDIDEGSLLTLGRVLPEFVQVDFTDVKRFPIPVVMFMGRHDYTTPTAPTEAWLKQVQAPSKQAVWFEHSAHMVPWEEPGKVLVSLLQYVKPLAR